MSSEVNSQNYGSTLPYSASLQYYSSQNDENIASTQLLNNDQDSSITPIKSKPLQNFPSPFIHLMQKAALISPQELDDCIEFTSQHCEKDTLPFNFFDCALDKVNKNDINKAKDVLKLQIAINKLKLYYFFNENETIIQKIKTKNCTEVIEHIISPLKTSVNPSLSDLEYMPIYECLLELKDVMFISFFKRCLYTLQWQQNPENVLKTTFYKKGSALIGHGIGYAKRGLRNLANLILEGELKASISTGPIGAPEAVSLKSFTCSSHGPFYLLIKNSTLNTHKKHLAYIVPQPIDKELLTAIINIAFQKNIISEDQKKLSIARIFTMQEFLDLPEPTISSDALEKYIQIKLNYK